MALTEQQGKAACARVMGHTPGPWGIYPDSAPTSVYCDDELGSMIADCHADYTVIPKEQEIANAKLIAAAPDLVEAIQWAITALADDGGMIDTGELIATVDKVRKRLQKAMKPLI